MTLSMLHTAVIDGSALVFRADADCLLAGVQPEGGETRWFEGYELSSFSDGIAVLRDATRHVCCAVDRRGNPVLEPKYEDITAFAEGRAFALDRTTVLVDTGGAVVKRFEQRLRADVFHDGLAVIDGPETAGEAESRLYGLVDRTGEFVIPPCYHTPWREAAHHVSDRRCCEGLVRVMIDGLCGYVDRANRPVIRPQFERGTRFSEGLAGVRLQGRWGFIDRHEATVLPFEWDDAQPFVEGIAPVLREGRWGAIDTKGRLVVPQEFQELSTFLDGHAVARTDFGCGLIDRTGNFFVPPIYDDVTHFHEGIAWVTQRGVRGVLDRTLAVLWDNRIR